MLLRLTVVLPLKIVVIYLTQPPKTVPPTMCEFSETGEAGRLVKKGGMVEVYFFEEWVVLEVKQVGNRRS